MATYTLEVEIGTNQIGWLISNGFELCVARQINQGQYTVIWDSKQISVNETFSWQESFQTFWVETFKSGLKVSASSNIVDIAYGQTVIIQPDSTMSNATGTPDQSGIFHVVNNYAEPVNIGINSRIGTDAFAPLFVSPNQILFGQSMELEPLNTIKLWFQKDGAKGSMIEKTVGASLEVTYGGVMDNKVTYKGESPGNGEWALSG
ncbi:hypothetical protein M408DRAFT_163619 [Serendipita vermifera MAFF 305830]|uniref:Uncharacterized protein n=1 Tax=Serendipita vermifera MAFF 305830 TaxID=933852 RepID=A0A0C2WN97_SERVB|nr:hypothetical protein M408DRAFT_163619 [Serendipita vermifera MAFF 305830]